ncbi:MAG: PCYCGC domain-containing protein [Acidobacteriota bacterium]|nr:PCYCGC domain-containing protein [Acidobacteriota bacterium]
MQLIPKISAVAILFTCAFALLVLPQQSVSGASSSSPALSVANAQQFDSSEPVPAFHTEAPAGALPATMSPDTFGDPVVQNAYTVAARIKKVLYQEPCYCHCDRSQGHTGLLDCFVSKHGSGCDICVREDLYAYEQTKKGQTPAQIRQGIMQGDWKSVDLSKYRSPLPAPHK